MRLHQGRFGSRAPGSRLYQRMNSRSTADRSTSAKPVVSPNLPHKTSSTRMVCRAVPLPLLLVTGDRVS